MSLYLENSGQRAGNAQYGQMLCAADGKVGKPGGGGGGQDTVQQGSEGW